MTVPACKKSNSTAQARGSSLSFSANDTLVNFPVTLVYIQVVTSLQTTLITGQYADSSANPGNINIRIIGDTSAGRFSGDSLVVTYTNGAGVLFTNTTDSSNFVQIDKFPKTAYGMVSGSFACKVASAAGSIQLTGGLFIAPYQD